MLAAMAYAMNWRNGLIVGVTRARLAEVAGRSATTVSRLWAWAEAVGLLVRVEQGAPKEWLGSKHNRAAAFVFVIPTGTSGRLHMRLSPQVSSPVDNNGNHTLSSVSNYPLRKAERLDPSTPQEPNQGWALYRIPETPSEREAAGRLLISRIGLDAHRLNLARYRGLLRRWWDEGVCVAGLLWALDHHPDRPDINRGDALRGMRDPIAGLGYRLAPWSGRLAELPHSYTGRRGDYLAAQAERLATAVQPSTASHRPCVRMTGDAARAARVQLAEHLAARARKRTSARSDRSPGLGVTTL